MTRYYISDKEEVERLHRLLLQRGKILQEVIYDGLTDQISIDNMPVKYGTQFLTMFRYGELYWIYEYIDLEIPKYRNYTHILRYTDIKKMWAGKRGLTRKFRRNCYKVKCRSILNHDNYSNEI